MADRYQEMDEDRLTEHRLEIENRIKNLFWTISGDYSLEIHPDIHAFARSKYIALYDAIKKGAFAKRFDLNELTLYMVKKLYMEADERPMLELVQLSIDAAVYPGLRMERKGMDEIRKKAFTDLLAQEDEGEKNIFSLVRTYSMQRFLGQIDKNPPLVIKNVMREIDLLSEAESTGEIIAGIDKIYNTFYDSHFEELHGDLQAVLDVPPLGLFHSVYADALTDEEMQTVIKRYLEQLGDELLKLETESDDTIKTKVRIPAKKQEPFSYKDPDREALLRTYEYVELNYGKAYLPRLERRKLRARMCTGIHKGCRLLRTKGILQDPVKKNNQYRFNELQNHKNIMYYYGNHWIIKRNIAILSDALKKQLAIRNDEATIKARSGDLVPARLWRLNRTEDVKLFNKKIKGESNDFVVSILLDASGSQAKRQHQVASQGYIISSALSEAGIPHCVESFCTFWDYTILQRFRDFDDPDAADKNLFQFRASANNRDGLAIRIVTDTLLKRPEEHKILLILSDGKPNDTGRQHTGSEGVMPYTDEVAVKDTAFEVRKARAGGIAVLGIFAGDYEDLAAEKKIFGKDFAYIRNITNFSFVVGSYLRKQLEVE